MRSALLAIPGRTELIVVEGAPHGIPPAASQSLPAQFLEFAAR
jgi:hypothetical protein